MTCDTITALLPLIGTVVGGFIGYFAAIKVSDRREFQKAAADFHGAFLDAVMNLDQRYFSEERNKGSVFDILNRTFPDQIRAMLKFRLYLPRSRRISFDSAWNEYCHYDIKGGPEHPFLEQYFESAWEGEPTKDLALRRIKKLIEFSEFPHFSLFNCCSWANPAFERDCAKARSPSI